jgi:23S rRNA (uracil1939-C5)-methyltransferase
MNFPKTFEVVLEGLTHDGRGVGIYEGQKVFVQGGVPGDEVRARVVKTAPQFIEAEVVELIQPSADRVTPKCELFGECGGCQLQHLSIEAQRHWKQQNFLTPLFHALNPKSCEVAEPLIGSTYAYRRRAKWTLGRDKADKQPKLGFRQWHSQDLVDVARCPVVTDGINETLADKRAQILPQASRKYQEWMAVEADNGVYWSRLGEPSEQQVTESLPYYALGDLKLYFHPAGFVQVNAEVNQKMVAQALEWLAPQASERVLDLFCGIGNFTLPLAQRAKEVVGVEGLAELVSQAQYNAEHNALSNVSFYQANLFEQDFLQAPWSRKQTYDAVLLDPGRPGAQMVCEQMAKWQPKRIVYVSCHVATLIRDVKILAEQGYELVKAGMIDMFPQTYHTEAMVLLQRRKKKKARPNKRIFRM